MNRLVNTKEAARATGLSEYELRMGAKQGRYPVILIGDEDSCVHRLRWNLDALEETIKRRTGLNCAEDKKDLPTTLSK